MFPPWVNVTSSALINKLEYMRKIHYNCTIVTVIVNIYDIQRPHIVLKLKSPSVYNNDNITITKTFLPFRESVFQATGS